MELNHSKTPYESVETSCLPTCIFKLAKVVGFEPTIMVLETTALDQTKLHRHIGGG